MNLLDTHTLIWFLSGDKQLSYTARKAIQETNTINFLSIASLWEIAIKVSVRKLNLSCPLKITYKKLNRIILNYFLSALMIYCCFPNFHFIIKIHLTGSS